ncbi:putative unusual protein kinase [Rubrobacter radiotolerans]|uniref:AarF/UbiB family protein n=2 Tax=Rubrobacter radiotolerans TaxID=42256 RepID=A0A023X4U9_RUBRA|nr:AarF/UbiB family protein [Rubrobacter radiotolerans]AHY47378.1 putative unusual protein kinase [Rubrobacter radiotolerans]MDX5894782.1 AarF/UbiB family protein [Rubrobacter radiotolerans]SMC06758.1 ubiquinone biosynthesis protein [Rubrobacter radiotolerans DSM 5868]
MASTLADWQESLAEARGVLMSAVRRSRQDSREAREKWRRDRAERGAEIQSLEVLSGLFEQVRSRSFLAAWAALAAGERAGRPALGSRLPPVRLARTLLPSVFSPRTLALGTAALDLYTSYAAFRERSRWFTGLAEEKVRERELEALHRRGAGRALDVAQALGGSLIKAGQFASTRPDLLPPAYTKTLSTLQDRVPPRPFAVIKRAVERETGRPLKETFSEFDREAVAAASIAQVHRARLKGSGREVAVKVRYPEVAGLIEEDLDSLEAIFDGLARLEPEVRLRPISDYLRWTLPLELDLAREARAMESLRKMLSDREDVVVPETVPELCTESLVVMEYVPGLRVNDRAALEAAGLDPKRVAWLINDAFADQLFRRRVFHADPHPGNLRVQPGPKLVLLDHGLTLSLERDFVETLARMVAALRDGDFDALKSALRETGLPVTDDTDVGVLLELLGVVMGGEDEPEEAATTIDLGSVAGRVGAGIRDLPPRLLLVGRAIGLLDGITRQLDDETDALEIVGRYAGKLTGEADQSPA